MQNKHHRQSIRLKGYDYSQSGAYFITICAYNKKCLFGEIVDNEMRCNDAGKIINKWWLELGNKFLNIELGEYIVMPNHFHGIISIVVDDDVNVNVGVGVGQPRMFIIFKIYMRIGQPQGLPLRQKKIIIRLVKL